MNGKLKKYFEGAGLHINGNYAYGMLNNYEINVQVRVLDTVAPVLIHVSCFTTQVQKMQIDAELRAEKIKQLNHQFTPYGITLGLNDFTVGALVKRLDRDLGKIFAIISQNGALGAGYCPVCGNPLDFADSKKANVEGFTISIDNTCVQEINAVIAEDEQEFQFCSQQLSQGTCWCIDWWPSWCSIGICVVHCRVYIRIVRLCILLCWCVVVPKVWRQEKWCYDRYCNRSNTCCNGFVRLRCVLGRVRRCSRRIRLANNRQGSI